MMLTAKDVREVQFRHTMGGYKTAEVDDFLDRCAETIEALTSSNEENKNKMQVLAETVVEYRNQEDSIRFALINAQRMAESVVKEAQDKADALLADAKSQAEDIVTDAEEKASNAREQALKDIETEHNELLRVRKEVADFKSRLLSTYREHLTLIGILEDEQPEESAEEQESVTVPAEVSAVHEEVAPTYEGDLPDFSAFELKDDE